MFWFCLLVCFLFLEGVEGVSFMFCFCLFFFRFWWEEVKTVFFFYFACLFVFDGFCFDLFILMVFQPSWVI